MAITIFIRPFQINTGKEVNNALYYVRYGVGYNVNSKKGMNVFDELKKKFCDVFQDPIPEYIVRTSGRVELLGGHTDYNEGFVLAAAIDKYFCVTAGPRDDKKICLFSDWIGQRHEFTISPELSFSADYAWTNYARGIVAILLNDYSIEVKGCNLYISGNVPVGAGLSSSAALELSIAKAVLHIAGPASQPVGIKLAAICQKAENEYAHSPCGIMDQIVCGLGKVGQAVFLDCRDLSIEYEPFENPDYKILVINSMVRHEIGEGEYGERRTSCEKAVDVISQKYSNVKALRDVDLPVLEEFRNDLDPVTYKRALHVVQENDRVLQTRKVLQEGDYEAFGRLMNDSHHSARDHYEISCPEIDFIIEQLQDNHAVLGSRLCGGGFGGSVVSLVLADACEAVIKELKIVYQGKYQIQPETFIVSPSNGIEEFKSI